MVPMIIMFYGKAGWHSEYDWTAYVGLPRERK